MSDEVYPDEGEEPNAIGVGMGGSCPVCRAPVDLGQEFCLECGSPIRFTPRQRRPRTTDRAAASSGAPAGRKPPSSGFPWIPFAIVLALIGGGIAFALLGGDDDKASKKTKTSKALPTLTNTVPTTSTATTTLQDCDPTLPFNATQPAGAATTSSIPSGSEQIPTISADGTSSVPDPTGGLGGPGGPIPGPEVPATDPGIDSGGSSSTVTVDQNGDVCPPDDAEPSTEPTTTSDTTSGAWPAGRSGWTVVVFGYDNEARAKQSHADLQEDGFTDGGVLFSSDYPSLCPGFYVVFSGVFDTKAQAEDREQELAAKGYPASQTYPREIRTTGSPPATCKPATTSR